MSVYLLTDLGFVRLVSTGSCRWWRSRRSSPLQKRPAGWRCPGISSGETRSRSAGRCLPRSPSSRSQPSERRANTPSFTDLSAETLRLTPVLYLEGLFVDVDVVPSFNLLGLAEEDEILEEENVAQVFFASAANDELVLTAKLTLLLQIDLRNTTSPSNHVTHSQTDNISSFKFCLVFLKYSTNDCITVEIFNKNKKEI